MAHDVIVVGAGSAGCVLAARLSEEAHRDVLLVEAGPDYPTRSDLPDDVADASAPTFSHDWGYASEPGTLGRAVPLPRARLVGGCAATNAAFLVRGHPADYDAWAATGVAGWGFRDLLPTFRAVESDLDFADEWHGTTGPIPVRRPAPEELTPLQRAFLSAAVACGHPFVPDHNHPDAQGVGPLPRNAPDGLRLSTALTHLAPARQRDNLTIRADAVVDRVELAGSVVRGVRLAGGELLPGGAVVLAAGTYGSPAILLRSGVGDPEALRAVGIAPRVELPGVGDNLRDHPLVAVDLPTAPGFDGPRFQVLLTLRSTRCRPDASPDLQVFAAGPFDDPDSPTGGVFGLVTALVGPRSRGAVRLRTADPADPPVIDSALLDHRDDLARMVEATQHARVLARTEPLRDLVRGPELAPGAAIADDDVDALAASIRRRVSTYHHPVGTCAMGAQPAAGAVVDGTGAVHGVAGLWVADASVVPFVPGMPTNLTTIVVATRIADLLARAG